VKPAPPPGNNASRTSSRPPNLRLHDYECEWRKPPRLCAVVNSRITSRDEKAHTEAPSHEGIQPLCLRVRTSTPKIPRRKSPQKNAEIAMRGIKRSKPHAEGLAWKVNRLPSPRLWFCAPCDLLRLFIPISRLPEFSRHSSENADHKVVRLTSPPRAETPSASPGRSFWASEPVSDRGWL